MPVLLNEKSIEYINKAVDNYEYEDIKTSEGVTYSIRECYDFEEGTIRIIRYEAGSIFGQTIYILDKKCYFDEETNKEVTYNIEKYITSPYHSTGLIVDDREPDNILFSKYVDIITSSNSIKYGDDETWVNFKLENGWFNSANGWVKYDTINDKVYFNYYGFHEIPLNVRKGDTKEYIASIVEAQKGKDEELKQLIKKAVGENECFSKYSNIDTRIKPMFVTDIDLFVSMVSLVDHYYGIYLETQKEMPSVLELCNELNEIINKEYDLRIGNSKKLG